MADIRKVNGSITVEAVLLFPIVLFIIIAFMFFTMYLHDRTIIHCVMNEACERFNQSVKQPTNYDTGVIYYGKMTDKSLLSRFNGDYSVELKDMKSYINKKLKKRMMLTEVTDIQIEKGIDDVSVMVSTKNQIPLVPVLVYLKGIQKRTYEVEGGIYNPSEYARAADVSLDVISQTEAYDKLVELFSKLNQVIG